MLEFIASKLSMPPEPSRIVVVFFAYSLLGYLLECAVLSAERRSLVIDRGFARHMPFCVIYGFGALLGYGVLHHWAHSLPLLFLLGALAATALEYATATLQIKLFGSFWWDYTHKPLNYKGIVCLESTLGWGLVALLVIKLLHENVVDAVQIVPTAVVPLLAAVLLLAYALDFVYSARHVRSDNQNIQIEESN